MREESRNLAWGTSWDMASSTSNREATSLVCSINTYRVSPKCKTFSRPRIKSAILVLVVRIYS